MFIPKLLTTLKNYNKDLFYKDLTSGIIVGIVALPLAIAFGIASGVSPEKGLITAIIAGFIMSLLGGSKVQIGGPTGAFIIIVFGIVQKYGIDGLMIATLMSGLILILMGLFKFGTLIRFIPIPIITGFTSGIAIIIFTTQIKDLLGLNIQNLPSEFLEKIPVYFENITSFNSNTIIVSLISLLLIIFLPKVLPKLTQKIPSTFIALLIGTLVANLFGLNVETIGSKFGSISNTIPSFSLPSISYEKIYNLIGPSFTIAILASVESLLSAVIADGMIGGKHRSNMELIANGVANMISPLFGGIPATGAIARTVTNIKNGGRTPIAGIIHAVTLFIIMLFLGHYAEMIPLAVLASILVIVAYNMSEWREFKAQLKMPRSDVIVLLTTFFLTVIFDLTIAIEVGMVLSAFLFMNRMAQVTNVGIIKREFEENNHEEENGEHSVYNKNIPNGIMIYDINGPFFFGAASKFKETLRVVDEETKVLIIGLKNVPAIDATGLTTLEDFYKDSMKRNITLILSGIHAQPLFAAERAGLIEEIGRENVRGNIDDAISRAKEVLNLSVES